MAFTSWSLSDEELENLDPWLKKNLGKAGEGSEWTIERQKDGSVQAMLIGKDGTARSRKTIPSTVAPKEPEKFKDPWAKQEEAPAAAPVEEAEEVVKPAAPVKGRRDFRRPASRQSTQSAPISSARFKPRAKPTAGPRYTPPEPTARREGPSHTPLEPKSRKEGPSYTPYPEQKARREGPSYTPYPEPKARREGPSYTPYPEQKARPVEEDLPPVIDPAEKRKKSRTATAAVAEDAEQHRKSMEEKWAKEDKESGHVSQWGTTADPPFTIPESSDELPSRWEAMGMKEDAVESKDTPPAWINEPGVGVSSPGLLRSTARSEAQRNAKGEGGMGGGQFWTNPKDGTTYFRPKTEEADLPAEVDLSGVDESKKRQTGYTVVKEAGVGEETKKRETTGFGLGSYLKAIGGGIKRAITGNDMPDYIRNPPQESVAMTLDMPKGMRRDRAEFKAQQAVLDHFINTYHPDDITIEKDADGATTRSFKGSIRNLGGSIAFWMDEGKGLVHLNYDPNAIEWTPETQKKKTDSKVKIESERFEGTPPEELETEEEQIEVDLEDPAIIDRLTNPLTPAPVDNPEPIELPFKTKTDERSDTKKVKDSPVASDMVIKTQEALGTDWKSPAGQIVITSAALEEEASTEPEPPYRLTIDPNVNIATVLDSQGMEVRQFAVGTGDTTGTRYGKKYFTPTGTAEVINKVPYEQVEGSYGPIWMGLDWKSYGLHGPHAAADIKATGTGFENQGFVSHGCIRFMEKDLMDLAEYLNVGSSVEVLPYRTRPLHRGPLRVGAK